MKDDVIGGAVCSNWEDENCTQILAVERKVDV